jgi:hypothetical protein
MVSHGPHQPTFFEKQPTTPAEGSQPEGKEASIDDQQTKFQFQIASFSDVIEIMPRAEAVDV